MTLRLEDSPAPVTAEAPPPADDAAPARKARSAADDLRCAKEVRILVVDDDEATGKVIEAALHGYGFHIRRVSDPEGVRIALETTPQEAYHLILLDYVLPGLEAEQVFAWVRDFQSEASVIVVTGYPSIDSALSCLRARTYDYITKPFQIAQLRQVVMRCLEGKGLLRMSEEALRESLGMAIRERRKGLGLTLAQMAARTDVSLGYLSQIELGKNSASIETLYRICLALGIKMAELFGAVQRSS
ncbi:MAG TPA: response regulator [Gemmataceae bacterium]|jgi:CheY-like chemotaxis protein